MSTTIRGHWDQYRSQEGSLLIITLAVVLFLSLLTAALLTYANTSQRASVTYRDIRDARYAGDGAIEAAINWVSNKPNVAKDKTIGGSQEDCVYKVETDVGPVTVTCGAADGSESGAPNEMGQLPPEALLLLGKRVESKNDNNSDDDEPGPYNAPLCKGWWDDVTGFFKGNFDPDDSIGFQETSVLFKPRIGLGTLNTTCNSPANRAWQQFKVDGDVVAAGRILGYSTNGGIQNMSGQTKARWGCAGGGMSCSESIGNRVAGPNVPADLVGTPQDSDPGRKPSEAGKNKAPVDLRDAFLPIGFASNGTLGSGYTTTGAGANYPVRTTAYVLNNDGTLDEITSCPPAAQASRTIVFLPGWYRDANVLNNYTANTSCNDRTFWLAPDPGPDGKLLTEDDRSGSFYFDFTQTTNPKDCGTAPGKGAVALKHKARWCIGANAANNPRVVTGSPNDWTPIGVGSSPGVKPVLIDMANTIDNDLSQVWDNWTNAAKIDGSYAEYKPALFSIDRSIRVRNFSPKATSASVDNRVFVNVAYALTGGASAITPKIEVRAVSKDSGQKNCGTFSIPKVTGTIATVSISASDATTLADNCGQLDLINGFEVRLLFPGNFFNIGNPRVLLDGVSITYDGYAGAAFPNPLSTADKNAKTDCDPTKPGAQLIFGGESHVLVADGSLEVCAGPHPTDPEDHQQIGVFGVPAVDSVEGERIIGWGQQDGFDPTRPNGSTITATSPEPFKIDSKEVTFHYGNCAAFCSGSHRTAWLMLRMKKYEPPAGYEVVKIQARVAYNPKNAGCNFLFSCSGANPQLATYATASGNNYGAELSGCRKNYPKNPNRGPLNMSYRSEGLLYQKDAGISCLTPAMLAAGANISWDARAECVLGVCKAGGGYWTDTLDGIELEVTIAPVDPSEPWLTPQSGCIIAHPNYNSGEGAPDCAIMRSAVALQDDNFNWWGLGPGAREAQSVGRFAVHGTIYAPSAALDVDENDAAYSLAERGAILRHLRVTGYGPRDGTDNPAVGHSLDRTPHPREAMFVACTRAPANVDSTEPCGSEAGDVLLTKAKVRFEIDPTNTVPDEEKARVPKIEWWSTQP